MQKIIKDINTDEWLVDMIVIFTEEHSLEIYFHYDLRFLIYFIYW